MRRLIALALLLASADAARADDEEELDVFSVLRSSFVTCRPIADDPEDTSGVVRRVRLVAAGCPPPCATKEDLANYRKAFEIACKIIDFEKEKEEEVSELFSRYVGKPDRKGRPPCREAPAVLKAAADKAGDRPVDPARLSDRRAAQLDVKAAAIAKAFAGMSRAEPIAGGAAGGGGGAGRAGLDEDRLAKEVVSMLARAADEQEIGRWLENQGIKGPDKEAALRAIADVAGAETSPAPSGSQKPAPAKPGPPARTPKPTPVPEEPSPTFTDAAIDAAGALLPETGFFIERRRDERTGRLAKIAAMILRGADGDSALADRVAAALALPDLARRAEALRPLLTEADRLFQRRLARKSGERLRARRLEKCREAPDKKAMDCLNADWTSQEEADAVQEALRADPDLDLYLNTRHHHRQAIMSHLRDGKLRAGLTLEPWELEGDPAGGAKAAVAEDDKSFQGGAIPLYAHGGKPRELEIGSEGKFKGLSVETPDGRRFEGVREGRQGREKLTAAYNKAGIVIARSLETFGTGPDGNPLLVRSVAEAFDAGGNRVQTLIVRRQELGPGGKGVSMLVTETIAYEPPKDPADKASPRVKERAVVWGAGHGSTTELHSKGASLTITEGCKKEEMGPLFGPNPDPRRCRRVSMVNNIVRPGEPERDWKSKKGVYDERGNFLMTEKVLADGRKLIGTDNGGGFLVNRIEMPDGARLEGWPDDCNTFIVERKKDSTGEYRFALKGKSDRQKLPCSERAGRQPEYEVTEFLPSKSCPGAPPPLPTGAVEPKQEKEPPCHNGFRKLGPHVVQGLARHDKGFKNLGTEVSTETMKGITSKPRGDERWQLAFAIAKDFFEAPVEGIPTKDLTVALANWIQDLPDDTLVASVRVRLEPDGTFKKIITYKRGGTRIVAARFGNSTIIEGNKALIVYTAYDYNGSGPKAALDQMPANSCHRHGMPNKEFDNEGVLQWRCAVSTDRHSETKVTIHTDLETQFQRYKGYGLGDSIWNRHVARRSETVGKSKWEILGSAIGEAPGLKQVGEAGSFVGSTFYNGIKGIVQCGKNPDKGSDELHCFATSCRNALLAKAADSCEDSVKVLSSEARGILKEMIYDDRRAALKNQLTIVRARYASQAEYDNAVNGYVFGEITEDVLVDKLRFYGSAGHVLNVAATGSAGEKFLGTLIAIGDIGANAGAGFAVPMVAGGALNTVGGVEKVAQAKGALEAAGRVQKMAKAMGAVEVETLARAAKTKNAFEYALRASAQAGGLTFGTGMTATYMGTAVAGFGKFSDALDRGSYADKVEAGAHAGMDALFGLHMAHSVVKAKSGGAPPGGGRGPDSRARVGEAKDSRVPDADAPRVILDPKFQAELHQYAKTGQMAPEPGPGAGAARQTSAMKANPPPSVALVKDQPRPVLEPAAERPVPLTKTAAPGATRAEHSKGRGDNEFLNVPVAAPRMAAELPAGTKGRREFHLTVIEPPEWKLLPRDVQDALRAGLDIPGEPSGGRLVTSKNGFPQMAVDWPQANALRAKYGLPAKEFHISLSGGINAALTPVAARPPPPVHPGDGAYLAPPRQAPALPPVKDVVLPDRTHAYDRGPRENAIAGQMRQTLDLKPGDRVEVEFIGDPKDAFKESYAVMVNGRMEVAYMLFKHDPGGPRVLQELGTGKSPRDIGIDPSPDVAVKSSFKHNNGDIGLLLEPKDPRAREAKRWEADQARKAGEVEAWRLAEEDLAPFYAKDSISRKVATERFTSRKDDVSRLYKEVKEGKTPLPDGVTLQRLTWAVDGHPQHGRVPLNFKSVDQYLRFQAELKGLLAAEGITDATIQAVGSGTTGWRGNPNKEIATWKPGSDADFAVFSKTALTVAMKKGVQVNPKITMDGKYTVLKNGGEAGQKGFNDTPLGDSLLKFVERWNVEVYGEAARNNPKFDGFDFKLNLTLKPFDGALTVAAPAH